MAFPDGLFESMASLHHGATPGPPACCFPKDSRVQLKIGKWIQMADLEVGDRVLSRKSNGQLGFSKVYLFGHRSPNDVSNFVNLKTATSQLKLSPEHHVCVVSDRQETKAARDVIVGDTLITFKEDANALKSEMVESVTISEDVGLFAPFTMSGTLIVDGVLASCYIDAVPPEGSHRLLIPVRSLYKLSPLALKAVSKPKKNGIPQWINWFIKTRKSASDGFIIV